MTKYIKPGTLVELTWEDAWGSNSWRSVAEALTQHREGDYMVCSVGYVILHDDRGISMTSGTAASGELLGQAFRPKSFIRKIKELKGSKCNIKV